MHDSIADTDADAGTGTAAAAGAVMIAIVSDTHLPRGDRTLSPACLERLRAADVILHAGDICTAAVLDELCALGPPLHAVHGNVDEALLQNRLGQTVELELRGVRLAMIHDAGAARGRLRRLRARFGDADVVIFGHSHMPLHETDGAGFQIFNPGSPTERRRAPHRTIGLARVEAGSVRLRHVVV
jgi:putative phosphoesterase